MSADSEPPSPRPRGDESESDEEEEETLLQRFRHDTARAARSSVRVHCTAAEQASESEDSEPTVGHPRGCRLSEIDSDNIMPQDHARAVITVQFV